MKYQLTNFWYLLKKYLLKWLIIIFFLLGVKILIMTFNSLEISYFDFKSLIGIFIKEDFKSNLLNIFQHLFILYGTVIFVTYEVTNSPEYILLRTSSKKWVMCKILTLFLFILIFKFIIINISIMLLKDYIEIRLYDLILCLTSVLVIPLLLFSYLSFINRNIFLNLVNILFHTILVIILLLIYNNFCFLITSILLIINIVANFKYQYL